jgi:hypothetical protein
MCLKHLGLVKGKSLDGIDKLMLKFMRDVEQQNFAVEILLSEVVIIEALDSKDDASVRHG